MSRAKQLTPARPGCDRSVRATSSAMSALPAPEVQTFWPVTDHPPSTGAAKAWTLVRSDPASGSDSSWHHDSSPRHDAGQVGEALLVGAELEQHRRRHLQGDGQHLGRDPVAGLLLGDDVGLPRRCAVTAVLDRPRPSGPAGVEQLPLPGAGDLEGGGLPRVVLLDGRGRHDVGRGEVLRAALGRGVVVEPGPHLGPEGLPLVDGSGRGRGSVVALIRGGGGGRVGARSSRPVDPSATG